MIKNSILMGLSSCQCLDSDASPVKVRMTTSARQWQNALHPPSTAKPLRSVCKTCSCVVFFHIRVQICVFISLSLSLFITYCSDTGIVQSLHIVVFVFQQMADFLDLVRICVLKTFSQPAAVKTCARASAQQSLSFSD